MGLNKKVEEEIKKDGFIKKNAKKGGRYVKNETEKFTNMKDIVYYSSYIKKMLHVMNPFKEKEKAREETFDNAIKRLDIDEGQLKNSFSYFKFHFYLGFVLFFASLFFGSYLILLKHNFWAFGPVVACISIGLSFLFIGSFRTFQINKRELCGVMKWKSEGFYFPKKFITNEEIKVAKRRESKKELQKLR